nr:hypothetical protein [Variovorax sp. HW608]
MTPEELLASNAALSGEVLRSQEALKIALLTIDKLKVELAYLRRMKYGRSSEQLEHAQLELVGGRHRRPCRSKLLRRSTPRTPRTVRKVRPTSARCRTLATSARPASKPPRVDCPIICRGAP